MTTNERMGRVFVGWDQLAQRAPAHRLNTEHRVPSARQQVAWAEFYESHQRHSTLTRRWPALTACFLALFCVQNALARTIVLTDADSEKIAAISSDAPRLSWAGAIYNVAEFSNHYIELTPKSAFLICYPLDRIPPGQRITKAEWIVPFLQVYPTAGVRLQVRRLLKDWGPGVSHEYRMIRPERLKWQTPGARGVGQDRASKATVTSTLHGSGEHTFNVTEDVELWYSGAVPNFGWILAAEDQETWVRTPSPFWGAPKGWKLRITFEPE
jgi:hypothetical protein